MRSSLTLIVLLSCLGGVAQGQPTTNQVTSTNRGLRAGFRLGLNVGSMDYHSYNGQFEWDARLAMTGSAFLVIPVHAGIALQPELSYNQKGTKFDSSLFSGQLALDYLEAGILANYTIPTGNAVKTYLIAGPTLGVLVNAETTTTYPAYPPEEVLPHQVTKSNDVQDQFNRLELGVVAGAGVCFGDVILDLRYQRGLTNVDNEDVGSDDTVVHTRSVTMTLGYLF